MEKIEVILNGDDTPTLIVGDQEIKLPFARGFDIISRPGLPTKLKFEMYGDNITIRNKKEQE